MSGLADRIDTAGLDALAGFAFPTFASRGGQTSAVAIAERCQRAQNWLADIFVSGRSSH